VTIQVDARARTSRVVLSIGLVLALGLPLCKLGDLGRIYSGLGPLWGGEAPWWGLALVLLLYVLFVERRPLSSLGFRMFKAVDVVFAVLAAVAIFGGDILVSTVLASLHLAATTQKVTNLFLLPLWFHIFVVTRAAVVEEIAFRGYGFERITELTGSRWLAALVTLALFTLAHYSGGGIALAAAAACGGVVLTALYMWRRNLWTNIIAHWIVDFVGFVVLPMLSTHH
jgi:uncharacterized protein